MAASSIKLILCDLGNVLINFDHRIAVRRIQSFTEKEFDHIHQLFFDSPLTREFEEGHLSPGDFFAALTGELALKNLSFENFSSIWNEIFFENEGMLEILRGLKKKHRLCLISNVNKLHFSYIAKTFPRHLEVFDKLYLSYEVGHCKPHEDIYRGPLKDAGVDPGETLYIDDRADLIREAKKMKIKTILFKNTDDLKKQLKRLKVPF